MLEILRKLINNGIKIFKIKFIYFYNMLGLNLQQLQLIQLLFFLFYSYNLTFIYQKSFYQRLINCIKLTFLQQLDKINNKQQQMDPRPYHFQYRRPRLNNPTYQSLKLYESIYQLNGFKKSNPEQHHNLQANILQKTNTNIQKVQQQRSTPQSQPQPLKRHQSSDIYNPNKTKINDNRYGSRTPRKLSDKSQLNSSLSQYGNNLVQELTQMQLMDQNRIYMKQQKQYDIISYQSKGYTPQLKNYPRLTLQDKIIQRRGGPDTIK